MKLGYFSMPMHPHGRTWRQTLAEDRAGVLLADSLGFHDAFIGEHLTDRHERVTNSLLFLATLIAETQHIKLATGTTNLSHQHPVLVAANSAMFDHLADGRFILGISPGALATDAEVLGILDEDRAQHFTEAIDVITGVWQAEAPYNLSLPGNRFEVSTERTIDHELSMGFLPKPLQQPRPEIVGTVASPFSATATMLGERGFHPLSANFLLTKWVTTHWPKYVEGVERAGGRADPADWRIARTIFVAESREAARDYVFGRDDSPYRFYYAQMIKKMQALGRLGIFKSDPDAPDSDVTLDAVMRDLVICGTPDEVADRVLEMRDEVGEFGELVYAGMDWVDESLARESMTLMANEVMPRVNRA